MKTLKQGNFKDRVVLLRSDLNSDVVKKKVVENDRIAESAKTIEFLKKQGARVVVIAHQGNPGKTDFISLKQHCAIMNKHSKLRFVRDIVGKRARNAISSLKSGEAILLENIRMEKDEFLPDKENNVLDRLINLAEVYVNDAFSVCHRNQFSIVGFPKKLESYAGLLLEKEVDALEKIRLKNCLYILGGAKPKDNMKLLKGKAVLACGLFGQLCVIAKGKDLGAQNEYLKDELKLIPELKKRLSNVQTPIDFAIKKDNKRDELMVEEFPSEHEIFDIGKKTQKMFVEEIMKAKAVFMKGPAGFAADEQFSKGTGRILRAIIKSKAYSVLGGGHLNDALQVLGISKKKFNHVSLSGGALLSYIAGEKLVGLQALK